MTTTRRRFMLVLVLALCSSAQADTRVQPPLGLDCPRDRLTLYRGAVVGYERNERRSVLRIRTEWDTTERVVVEHRGASDPGPRFRIDGRAFEAADWARIERAPGVLRPGTRVSAWVCEDAGVPPLIEWSVSAASGRR